MVCSVQCTVCSVPCEVCSVQCVVCRVQCTVNSVPCELWTLFFFAVHNKQCSPYSMQCAVCSVQCACAVSRVQCGMLRHGNSARGDIWLYWRYYWSCCTLNCKLFIVYFILTLILLYTVYFVLNPVHCKLYTLHQTMYTVYFILNLTLYIVQRFHCETDLPLVDLAPSTWHSELQSNLVSEQVCIEGN